MQLIKSKHFAASAENTKSYGFTLIELMIAMVIASIMTLAMYSVFQAQVQGQVTQDVSLEMTQSLRAAMELMVTDIRMAGCDPTQDADAGIIAADVDELRFTMDIGGGTLGEPNGEIETNEDVRYSIVGGNLCRETQETDPSGTLIGPQSIARHCDALNFVYLDEDNNPISTPVANTDDISAVQVCVVIGSAATEAENRGFLRAQTDNRTYTNLQGTEILAPQGDTVRRFQLNETIDCRNL